jgi:hypothetical protein
MAVDLNFWVSTAGGAPSIHERFSCTCHLASPRILGSIHQRYQLRCPANHFPRAGNSRVARDAAVALDLRGRTTWEASPSPARRARLRRRTPRLLRVARLDPHNRGRCPGLDCRIPIQQRHPRPRILTQSPSAQPIRRTPAASTPKSGRTVASVPRNSYARSRTPVSTCADDLQRRRRVLAVITHLGAR